MFSQAAAHPRRGTKVTRNGISCKDWRHATQPAQKMQRRKLLYFAIFTARNDASALSVSHCFWKTVDTDFTDILIGLFADERRHVKIVDARVGHHRTREVVS